MGTSSFKQSFSIESIVDKDESNLYIVTIGVSAYEQEQYKLSYARKDAEDILSYFTESHLYFEEVYSKSLLDEEVTIENVENLQSFINQAGENDVVILFAAGHGVLDANFDYFYGTYDMDFNNPSDKGLAYDKIHALLNKIKAQSIKFFDLEDHTCFHCGGGRPVLYFDFLV